jgi:uncharacterized protein (TIGR03437 family)
MREFRGLAGITRWGFTVGIATLGCFGQGVISTVAGNGTNAATGDGGPALSASFHPDGLTVDSAGNIYIADQNHNRIRKVDSQGLITTVAGNGNTQFSGDGGLATSASVYIAGNHNGLAVDALGNLYIADDGHHRIRKVDSSGIITTVAGTGTQGYSGDNGPATKAQLWRPSGIAVDGAGNLYIADTDNRRIRKVDTFGTITTLAGTGGFGYTGDGAAATLATMETPVDVAVDAQGNVYFADQDAATVRKVNAAGIISTVAGNGTTGFSGDGGLGPSASFASPYSVTVDKLGNVYISDYGNHRIREVDPSGIVTTIAGNGSNAPNNGDGGPPTSANVLPDGVAFDIAGNYYIADVGHNLIRKVTVGARVPGLSVSASSLYFSYAGGNQPNAQIVTAFTTGTVPLGFKISSSISTGGNWLNVPLQSGNTPTQITISISNLPGVGTYQGSVVLTPAAADLPSITIPVTLAVLATAPTRPVIPAGGVVNGASFTPGVVANSLATIQGTNLASVTDDWNNALATGQLPTSLDGVTVLFNGKPAYLTYISPVQINLIVPDIGAGTTPVVLTNHGTSPTGLFNVSASLYGPAFFTWPGTQIVATRQDYSYAVKDGTFPSVTTVPAKPGDVLILWGTGFGPTNPSAPPGIPVPGDKIYATSTLPTVTINNVTATVYGAALAPGYAGLYQVAIQVPNSLVDGDWPILASIGGVQSPGGVVLSVHR